MRVAAIQHDIVFEDAVATRAQVAPMIAQAAAANARVIVLTEMFATGFSMSPERIAEDEGGPSEQFLIDAGLAEQSVADRVDRPARRRRSLPEQCRRGRP